MPLQTGTRLGVFELVCPLGAGGMGEVYRARDTRLDRRSRSRSCPRTSPPNAELPRALRARGAGPISRLTHPHICTLYDVGHQDGDRLPGHGVPGGRDARSSGCDAGRCRSTRPCATPSRSPTRWTGRTAQGDRPPRPQARQRDADQDGRQAARLRPARKGGGAGLAAATLKRRPPRRRPSRSPAKGTLSARSSTWRRSRSREGGRRPHRHLRLRRRALRDGHRQAGLRGERARRASSRRSSTDEPPPIASSCSRSTPPALERVVRMCLAKDPDERWQNAHDVRADCAGSARSHDRSPAAIRRGPRPLTWSSPAAARGRARRWGSSGSPADRGTGPAALPRTSPRRCSSTTRPASSSRRSRSPDGNASSRSPLGQDGNVESSWGARLEERRSPPLRRIPPMTSRCRLSPDGRSIAFVSTRSSRTGLVPVGATFGLEREDVRWRPVDHAGPRRQRATDRLERELSRLAAGRRRHPLRERTGRQPQLAGGVRPDGTSAREVLASTDSRWEITRPRYSPDGRWISFEGREGTIFLLPTTGGKPHELLSATGHAWADDGSVFFYRRGGAGGATIGRVSVDPRRGQVAEPEQVVAVLTGTMRDLAVAPGSHELAVAELEAGFNLTRLPLSVDGSRPAGPEEPLSSGSVRDRYPAYSFDGRRLAFTSNRAGPDEVWVLDFETMRHERLTAPQDGLGTYFPAWLPDGNRLLVKRFRMGGPISLWMLALDGSRADQLDRPERYPPTPEAFSVSPDGHRALVQFKEGYEDRSSRARSRDQEGTTPDDDGRQQVRWSLVARRSPDRLHREHRRGAPALDPAGRGRRAAPAHLRRRAHASPVVLARRAVDLHPAEPPEHLARSRDRRARSSR